MAADGIGPRTRDEIRSWLDSQREALLAIARQLSAADWLRESACPGWRNRDLLAHLGESERRTREMAERASRGESTRDASFDLDAANAASVAAVAGSSLETLFERLEHERAATLALLDALPDDRLQNCGAHPRWGNPPASWVLWHIGDHEREHREHVRLAAPAHRSVGCVD